MDGSRLDVCIKGVWAQVTPGSVVQVTTYSKNCGERWIVVSGFAAYNCLYACLNSEGHMKWKYGEADFYDDNFEDSASFQIYTVNPLALCQTELLTCCQLLDEMYTIT
jgi:hypothetical protein